MSLTVIALIGLAIFLILMFLRMPIGLSFAAASFIGIWLTRGIIPSLSNLGFGAFATATSETLLTIPLYILMGELAANGGISRSAFTTCQTWVGQFPGGLAMATTFACAAFGAVCGSCIATAVCMCSVALPEMRRYKYDDELSTGVICMGGNLGIIIPPSGAFIIYGFATQTSIGALFISGILPGLLITLMVCITIYFQTRINPALAPAGTKTGWIERLKSLKGLWAILVLFIIVMGGIYLGIFTPTEAAAVGSIVALFIGLSSRQLSFRGILNSLSNTVMTSVMIFVLLIGAIIFNSFLATTEVNILIGNFITHWAVNPYVILAVILVAYIILGFFLDMYAVLLVTLPMLFPVVTRLGFDPIFFGVLCVFCTMIGEITPPVGVVTLSVSAMAKDVPVYKIFRGCAPYVITMIVCLFILVAFPQISLVLPSMMFPYR